MLISEIAVRDQRPGRTILRASRILSASGWNGNNYRLLIDSADEIVRFLELIPVGLVVIDRTPDRRDWPHQRLLEQAVLRPEWRLVRTYSHPRFERPESRIDLYRLDRTDLRPAKTFTVELTPTPSVVIE